MVVEVAEEVVAEGVVEELQRVVEVVEVTRANADQNQIVPIMPRSVASGASVKQQISQMEILMLENAHPVQIVRTGHQTAQSGDIVKLVVMEGRVEVRVE